MGFPSQPLGSPRTLPQKRALETSDEALSSLSPVEASPLKAPKLERTPGDVSPTGSTSAGSSFTLGSCSEDDQESTSSTSDNSGGFGHAIEAAMSTFKETWSTFIIQADGGSGDKDAREDRASKLSEILAAENYEHNKNVFLDLLPAMGHWEADRGEGNYQVVQSQGSHAPRKLKKTLTDSDLTQAQLEWLRTQPGGKASEAFCAMMAVLSTRKEKSWLDAHDRGDLDSELGPKKRSFGESARRKDAVRAFVEEWVPAGCGFFSHFLVKPHSHIRVAFAPAEPRPVPACAVIISRLPLFDALKSLDSEGPLRGDASKREWCMKSGRQFAFQLADLEADETEEGNHRMKAADLKPDPKLRDLLRSKKPVVVLEVVASLAPREVAKKHGLGEIVKAELARVMREAKSRGEAVVFCLGSDCPQSLAKKVYVREPISDHGLQCGYMRWRASPDAPWARERAWADRICLCLQMP